MYLYRAVGRDGNVVDSMLREQRDIDAAKHFFKARLTIAAEAPPKVTSDGMTPISIGSLRRWVPR